MSAGWFIEVRSTAKDQLFMRMIILSIRFDA